MFHESPLEIGILKGSPFILDEKLNIRDPTAKRIKFRIFQYFGFKTDIYAFRKILQCLKTEFMEDLWDLNGIMRSIFNFKNRLTPF